MSPNPPRDIPCESKYDYSTWTIEDREDDEFRYLGLKDDGASMFFHPAAKVTFEGVNNEEKKTIEPKEEESLEEELGEWLERVGERTGWESLSAFARDHLEGESENS